MLSISPFDVPEIDENELDQPDIGSSRRPEFIGPLPKMAVRSGLKLDMGLSRKVQSSLASFLTLMLMVSSTFGSPSLGKCADRDLGAAEKTVKAIMAEAPDRERMVAPVTFDTMKPTFDQNWVLVCEQRDYDKVNVGDIVAFKVEDSFYMHRVVAKNPDGTLTTKADAKPENDVSPVTADNYLGAVVIAAVNRDNGESKRFDTPAQEAPKTVETAPAKSDPAPAPTPAPAPAQATAQTPPAPDKPSKEAAMPAIKRTPPVYYRAICEASYGDALAEVLKAKADYRSAHPDLPVMADYDRLDVRVGVQVVPEGATLSTPDGQVLHMNARAAYIPEKNVILTTVLETGALGHENGHSLQRNRTMKILAEQKLETTTEIAMGLDFKLWPEVNQIRDGNAWDVKMAKYVGCQPELEVRLMALNRYHFAKHHSIIKSPADVVAAITAIDAKPTFKDVSAVFAKHGIEFSEKDYKAATKITRVKAAVIHKDGGSGDDVAEVSKLLTDSAYLNHDFYMQLLEKILMETPAHQ